MQTSRECHSAHRPGRVQLVILAACALLGSSCAVRSMESSVGAPLPETKRVLIITGEDYAGHDWRKTSPVLEAAIEADSRLQVDVLEDLGALGAKDLTAYAAVVLHFKNYDPEVPGRGAFDALDGFVEGGGGLLLVHFACGAFEEFKDDYEQLVGRVWMGATPPPGRAQHDAHGVFTVQITELEHPVTRGLTSFQTTDELYTCLVGETPIEVLAEAVSKRDGERYPMAFTFKRGQGRVFHCVLGHDPAAISEPPVAQLYRRAAAWAAGLDPVGEPVLPVSLEASLESSRTENP